MIPYYLLSSDNFNAKKIKQLSSTSQRGLDTVSDDAPISSITKNTETNFQGYTCYNLVTETEKHQKGRAYGKDEFFESFILVKNDYMFHNKTNKLLILSTSKSNFNLFNRRFKNNTTFKFNTVNVDFPSLIHNVLNMSTDGVWLGNLDNVNLNSIGLIGREVQDSSEFQKLIECGANITNISLIFNNNGIQEKIMITKDGGIILYQSKDLKDDLNLVVKIYKEMLLNH